MPHRPTQPALVALVVALALVSGLAPLATPTPAVAQATVAVSGRSCGADEGVTVVVDAQQLGDGVVVGCAPGEQADGFAALEAAGFGVNEDPGALGGTVCQIDRLPAAGHPTCWYSGFWSYWRSDGDQPWAYSDVGASDGPLPVGRVEGWSWTSPVPADYSGTVPRLPVADLAALALGPADCEATPQLPTFDIVDDDEVLPVTLADDHPVEVAVLTDPEATPLWQTADDIALTGLSGTVEIRARRVGDACPDAPVIRATYDVRGAYAPRWNLTTAGSPSPAVDKADPRIQGWATGHSEYTPGPGVTPSFQVPSNAYGPVDSSLVVLGDRGTITMTFDAPLADGPGHDLAVFENGFAVGTAANGLDFLELGYVEVSSDGETFARFSSASRRESPVGSFAGQSAAEIGGLAGKDLSGKGTPFDLALLAHRPEVRSGAVDLGRITHVRIVDIKGDGQDLDSFGRPIHDPFPTSGSGGFDLTGIAALNVRDEIAPAVEITSAPTGSVTSADAEITFTVDDPAATVEHRIDDGPWAPAASPLTLTGLAAGERTIEVRATDATGNTGSDTATWTVLGPRDCAAGPLLPDFGIIDDDEVLPVTLADGHPVEVAVLTDPAAEPTWAVATSVPLAGLAGPVRILARAAGDTCPDAPTFDATYDVRPTYAPRWSSPDAPGGPSPAVATDDPAIVTWATGWEDYVPGPNVADQWKTPDAATGPIGGFADLVVLGDRGTIAMTFTDPITDGAGADLAVFENGFVVGNGSSGLDFLELARVAVSSDGETYATFATASRRTTPVGAYEGQSAAELGGLAGKDLDGHGTPFDLTDLRNHPAVRAGTVDLDRITHVRITDVVGDGTDLDSFGRPIHDPFPTSGSGGFDLKGVAALNVDPVAPVITIDGPTGTVASADATIAFTVAPDGGATVECRTDGGPWGTCTSPLSREGLPDGPHAVEIRASRLGGEPVTTTHRWTVDTTPPTITVTAAPTGTVASADATIGFTVDDAAATVEHRIDDGPWAPAASPLSLTGLADGPHTLTIRATDAVGNAATADATWTVDRPSATEAWVIAAHHDLLDRPPTPTELAAAVDRLDAGARRATIAGELASSDEWLGAVVSRLYRDTLGRAPDAGGLAYWIERIRSGRATVAQVAAAFYASSEHHAGAGSDPAWIASLYETILHRPASDRDLEFWTARVRTRGRTIVAREIYGSLESRRDRVDALYRALLGRPAEAGGLAHWADVLRTRDDLRLAIHLVTSAEYAARATTRSFAR